MDGRNRRSPRAAASARARAPPAVPTSPPTRYSPYRAQSPSNRRRSSGCRSQVQRRQTILDTARQRQDVAITRVDVGGPELRVEGPSLPCRLRASLDEDLPAEAAARSTAFGQSAPTSSSRKRTALARTTLALGGVEPRALRPPARHPAARCRSTRSSRRGRTSSPRGSGGSCRPRCRTARRTRRRSTGGSLPARARACSRSARPETPAWAPSSRARPSPPARIARDELLGDVRNGADADAEHHEVEVAADAQRLAAGAGVPRRCDSKAAASRRATRPSTSCA